MINTSCRRCGTVQADSICATCAPKESRRRETRRPSRQARGYDAAYERARLAMIERAWSRQDPCVICKRPFAAKSDITAEHMVPLRRGGGNDSLGPAHGSCNSAWNAKRPPP